MNNFFKYLGHAGFWIRTSELDLIIDPWFSKKGAYYSGWYQWPPNQDYLKYLLKNIGTSNRKCYIYLSHEHEDHFCIDTLKEICSRIDITFILPKFEDKILEKKIFYNFNKDSKSIILHDKQTIDIENMQITLFIDDKGLNHDSAILLQSENLTFFNQNDCKMFDRLEDITKLSRNIDFYACQFSGANWHPSTFIMDEKEKYDISQIRNKQKFTNIAKSISVLSPKNYIASAGPVCFLDPDENYINLNTYNFPHSNVLFETLVPYLNKHNIQCKLLSPLPGDIIKDKVKNYLIPNQEDIINYRKKCFYGRPNLKVKSKEVISFLNKKLSKIKKFQGFCDFQGPIIMTMKNINYLIDFEKSKILIIEENNFPNNYIRIIASEWWFKLMTDNISGQILCLTMNPRIIRENKYCIYQNLFLFSNLDDIEIMFNQTLNLNEKRCIVKLDDNCKYEINQFCPHQGADLKNIKIIDGILTCPRHNISFDIKQGGKALNGINLTLNAKKI